MRRHWLKTFRRRMLWGVTVAGLVGLALAEGPVLAQGAATWQKDPDSRVDPVKVVTSTILAAPDVTIGDTDTTIAGIADVVVGINDTADNRLNQLLSEYTVTRIRYLEF